jgi:hypothetical protein
MLSCIFQIWSKSVSSPPPTLFTACPYFGEKELRLLNLVKKCQLIVVALHCKFLFWSKSAELSGQKVSAPTVMLQLSSAWKPQLILGFFRFRLNRKPEAETTRGLQVGLTH